MQYKGMTYISKNKTQKQSHTEHIKNQSLA